MISIDISRALKNQWMVDAKMSNSCCECGSDNCDDLKHRPWLNDKWDERYVYENAGMIKNEKCVCKGSILCVKHANDLNTKRRLSINGACYHCGQELSAWMPKIQFSDGAWREASTNEKWCPNCKWVI